MMILVQICLYSSRSITNMAILGMVERHEDATGGWSENRTCKVERNLELKRIEIQEAGLKVKKKFKINKLFLSF